MQTSPINLSLVLQRAKKLQRDLFSKLWLQYSEDLIFELFILVLTLVVFNLLCSYYAEPLAALAGVVCMNAVRFPTLIDKTLKIL